MLGSQDYLLRRIWGKRPSERTFSDRLVPLAPTRSSKLAGGGSPRGAFLLSALLPGSRGAFGEGRGGVLFF